MEGGCNTENKKQDTASEEVVCGDAVWEQLLQLAESGDIRAIKLYYEMMEKRQRADGEEASEMTRMAQIRRAVFGDADGES